MAITVSVADTRLLITLEFPPTEEAKTKVEQLIQRELMGRLLVPTIVLTEFLKVSTPRIGLEGALTRIGVLKSRGAKVVPLDEDQALAAGRLLLTYPNLPVADALIASLISLRKASCVVTDDAHFKDIGIRSRWF